MVKGTKSLCIQNFYQTYNFPLLSFSLKFLYRDERDLEDDDDLERDMEDEKDPSDRYDESKDQRDQNDDIEDEDDDYDERTDKERSEHEDRKRSGNRPVQRDGRPDAVGAQPQAQAAGQNQAAQQDNNQNQPAPGPNQPANQNQPRRQEVNVGRVLCLRSTVIFFAFLQVFLSVLFIQIV